jgi:hypothetical protein
MPLTLQPFGPETAAAQPGRPRKTMVCPTGGGIAQSDQVKVSGIESETCATVEDAGHQALLNAQKI